MGDDLGSLRKVEGYLIYGFLAVKMLSAGIVRSTIIVGD